MHFCGYDRHSQALTLLQQACIFSLLLRFSSQNQRLISHGYSFPSVIQNISILLLSPGPPDHDAPQKQSEIKIKPKGPHLHKVSKNLVQTGLFLLC